MKRTIQHIVIYCLTAIILVASTGFSVCCMFGCHDAKVASGEIDCCSIQAYELESEQDQKGCDGCQSEYVNLDASYLIPNFDLKSQAVFVPVAAHIFSDTHTIKNTSVATPWEFNLPPPAFGKELLIQIQTFLC